MYLFSFSIFKSCGAHKKTKPKSIFEINVKDLEKVQVCVRTAAVAYAVQLTSVAFLKGTMRPEKALHFGVKPN